MIRVHHKQSLCDAEEKGELVVPALLADGVQLVVPQGLEVLLEHARLIYVGVCARMSVCVYVHIVIIDHLINQHPLSLRVGV